MTKSTTDRSAFDTLALRLLEAEGAATSIAGAAERVFGKLHGKIKPMVGAGGFETVLGRAVILAARQHPALAHLQVFGPRPPTLAELMGVFEAADDDDRRVAAALIGEVVHFLTRLVGGPLILVLLRDLWPDVLADVDSAAPGPFSSERTHEG